MVLIQPEYFYSQECHLMDRGYQVLRDPLIISPKRNHV
ncbi:Uncharacterised protein [Escherichia coli]|nr:Uncharacterised protein [Escherichia coli]